VFSPLVKIRMKNFEHIQEREKKQMRREKDGKKKRGRSR
jgi:hypothetical protein